MVEPAARNKRHGGNLCGIVRKRIAIQGIFEQVVYAIPAARLNIVQMPVIYTDRQPEELNPRFIALRQTDSHRKVIEPKMVAPVFQIESDGLDRTGEVTAGRGTQGHCIGSDRGIVNGQPVRGGREVFWLKPST